MMVGEIIMDTNKPIDNEVWFLENSVKSFNNGTKNISDFQNTILDALNAGILNKEGVEMLLKRAQKIQDKRVNK